LIWEPARFGWAYTLGRAYLLSGDASFAGAFWQHFETFIACNPPNQGPNWASAQEVALRILAMTFAGQVLAASEQSTPERMGYLRAAIAAHAERIPATLPYARAQNNNHWISEAVGLYTAGVVLPDHPQARRWKTLGWDELHFALQNQIDDNGEYVQHSTNYHRLVLQAALWALAVARQAGDSFPEQSLQVLALATQWLYEHYDLLSGRAANLGHNDGAYILPLDSGGYADYRPVLQAAALAFLERQVLSSGAWDEFTRWLDLPRMDESTTLTRFSSSPARLGDWRTWGRLRAVHYDERPAHADQLHVDLWWQGQNVALDAGTYRYNAPLPWNNALSSTLVHNTVTIDGQEQMHRISKFLWLQWAQGQLVESGTDHVTAEHHGYAHIGVIHRRSLVRLDTRRWRINDVLLPAGEERRMHTARLHWLLPDWEWGLDGCALSLTGPPGRMVVSLALAEEMDATASIIQLIRCGEALFGPPAVRAILGWYSPTYGVKQPALSYSLTVHAKLPLHLSTHWTFDA
jgi:hypothetical protein